MILGQVKGVKEEVDIMIRKKEKVAYLLGATMNEHSMSGEMKHSV